MKRGDIYVYTSHARIAQLQLNSRIRLVRFSFSFLFSLSRSRTCGITGQRERQGTWVEGQLAVRVITFTLRYIVRLCFVERKVARAKIAPVATKREERKRRSGKRSTEPPSPPPLPGSLVRSLSLLYLFVIFFFTTRWLYPSFRKIVTSLPRSLPHLLLVQGSHSGRTANAKYAFPAPSSASLPQASRMNVSVCESKGRIWRSLIRPEHDLRSRCRRCRVAIVVFRYLEI